MAKFPPKDPDEVLDYGFIWTDWLDGDTIDASEWLTDDSIVIDSDSSTSNTTTVWLSGGTLNDRCSITNRITTAAGRVADRTARLDIKAK